MPALLAAVGADSADFGPRDSNFDSSILRNLPLQIFVEFAFHLSYFAAAQTGHVNVIARPMAFVEMAVAAQMQ